MGLFTSQYEDQAPGLFKDQMNALQRSNSSFSGINNINNVMSQFGLKNRTARDVNNLYNPARASVATRLAQANKRAADRMSGSNATPGMTFGNIESAYAPEFAGIESNAAQSGLNTEIGDQRYIADMLKFIMGGKDTYGLNKNNMQMSALNNYVNSLDKSSSLDDILSVGGTLGKIGTKSGKSNVLADMMGVFGL